MVLDKDDDDDELDTECTKVFMFDQLNTQFITPILVTTPDIYNLWILNLFLLVVITHFSGHNTGFSYNKPLTLLPH